MNVPFIDLNNVYELHRNEIDIGIKTVLNSGAFILGKYVGDFEMNISKYIGTSSLGCANGSDSLLLALMAEDIGIGDEVITTPFTFFATAGAISRVGATPVFVDIDPRTFNIDVSKIEKALTKRTKAIIPVHIFGQPAEMDKIMQIAKANNLIVIEDACQAIGSKYKGKMIGTIGDYGCFSFYPTKNLGAFGDAGLISCSNEEKYEKLKSLRVHGSKVKYYHEIIGFNSRLDAIQASVLDILLPYLNENNNKRIKIAEIYDNELSHILDIPYVSSGVVHTYHQYAVLVRDIKDRDLLSQYLTKMEIGNGVYYPLPLHLQKCFNSLGYKEGDFPVAEDIAKRILSLPMYPYLDNDQIDYVINSVNSFFNK